MIYLTSKKSEQEQHEENSASECGRERSRGIMCVYYICQPQNSHCTMRIPVIEQMFTHIVVNPEEACRQEANILELTIINL